MISQAKGIFRSATRMRAMKSDPTAGWLFLPRPNPQAALRLFCFPYAGGSANVYRRWPAGLPDSVEVCAVRLPGREGRFREPPFTRLAALVDALAAALPPALDRPFAFFGHSMGGLTAFELARRLRRDGLPMPRHLFLSARAAPQTPGAEWCHTLPEPQFREHIRGLGGTPREVLEHPELMQMLLPMLRADFAVCETHTHHAGEPLDCPITIFGGLDDTSPRPEQLEGWREHTRAAFRRRMFPGNHFFLHSAESRLLQILSEELAAAIRPGEEEEEWPEVGAVRPLADDEVHVWRVQLDQPDERLEALRRVLAPDEVQRGERFHFEKDRRHYVAGRGILRTLLGRYLGRNPADLQFGYNPQGKPQLAGESAGLRFNLAHSHGLALVALCRGREIGVDLERIRPEFAGDPVARRFFSPREVATLRALPAERRHEAFFVCWTRKEAYLKATGKGLTLPLDCFDVSLAPDEPAALLATRHDPDEVRRWSMKALIPARDYAGALAVEGNGWRLWRGHWHGG
jgi:medium-chain acyl-[acyl-carrier-protein] hydrolase